MVTQHLHVDCVVDPARPGVVSAQTRRFVNWEVFYLADARAAARFDADPCRYCTVLTDPVTRQRFRPGPDAPHLRHGGRVWYFPSDSSRAVFAAAPDSSRVPELTMVR